MDLALKSTDTPDGKKVHLLDQKIEEAKAQGLGKVSLEASIVAKQVNVIQVALLSKDGETGELRKDKPQKFAEGNLADPADQAKVNSKLFTGLSRQLYQLEEVQRSQVREYTEQGTIKLKLSKKLFCFKNTDKVKPELHIMIDFSCDHVTDVGGLKCISYRKELIDQLAQTNSIHSDESSASSEFYFTSDEPNQSINWLPQLVGSQKMSSSWHLQFLVPRDFTVLASGKRLEHSLEEDTALFEYEIPDVERNIPDKIGFVICRSPLTSSFDVFGKKEHGTACFLSRQKLANFNPKLASDMIESICSLMGVRHFPTRETKIVFLPNLFPAKFPKQSYCFTGGLHLLDQELLFKPNQIDKRHHLYKHLSSSLAYAFFGAKVREAEFSDSWLLVAIRERVGDRFTKSKCGALMYRYTAMKRIEKLYELMKEGVEVHPLQRRTGDPEKCPDLMGLGCPTPTDQVASDIFYKKCGLIMQMIELKIREHLDTILQKMYQQALQIRERTVSLVSFKNTFKQVCGIRLKEILSNWIHATSCPKLTLNYEYNKRSNTLELKLKQESATVNSMRVQKNLEGKIDKIFGMSEQNLFKELLGVEPDQHETFNVNQKAACKRWFTGLVNIVICQVDGGGSEILKQQHRMELKNFKSTVYAKITLQGKVRRTQNKKKDFDQIPQADGRRIGVHSERDTATTSQAAQMMLNQDVQKFEMNEFELEDFPSETKNIFSQEKDNNPVLWIRVDPDMEYIRKVKVVQKKRNNWLLQLLREQDIVGQIEAVRQLHKYNENLVYEILQTVSRKENYFYKVRKEVLKTMHKMEIQIFQKYLSHEAFLLRCFNEKNFDEVSGFYRENNFTNLLQYYLDRSVLKYISKSKEEQLVLSVQSQQYLETLHEKRSKIAKESNMEDAVSEKTPMKDQSADVNAATDQAQPSTMIAINFVQNQVAGIDTKSQKKDRAKTRSSAATKQHLAEISDYRITTERVAQMLLKVLEQNDNSENYFDDSFLMRDILTSLGRLDNINYIYRIACEIYRQFKLDQISNSSPQFAITTGAIKGYFNQRKQIFRFLHNKRQHIDEEDPFASHKMKLGHENGHMAGLGSVKEQKNAAQLSHAASSQGDQIAAAQAILDQMKDDIDGLLMNDLTPLQLRLFIFDHEIKNIIFYRSLPLVKALQVIFDAIYNLQAKLQIRFALFCLREIVMFCESVRFVGRMNFTELHIESSATKSFFDTLWSFVSLPHGFLSSEITYWIKRFINRVYGKDLPKFLINQSDMTWDPAILQTDITWGKSELALYEEDQQRIQLEEQKKLEKQIKNTIAAQTQAIPDQQTSSTMVQQQQQTQLNGQSSTVLTIGGANRNNIKIVSQKKKPVILKGDSGDKQSLISIRPGKISSSGITIKATNSGPANDHIMSVGGPTQDGLGQSKISILGSSSIRLAAGTSEAKLNSELQEAANQSMASGTSLLPDDQENEMGQSKAVVHIGPHTHTAITLQAPADQDQVPASQPLQLIVLPGKSQAHQQQLQDAQDDIDMNEGESDDEDDDQQSRSLIRIGANPNEFIVGTDQNQLVDDSDDDDSKDQAEKEAGVIQQQVLDASFAADDDVQMDDEADYGDERQNNDDEEDDDDGGNDDSVYDPFAAEKFDDPDMQKCWLILGKLYYHYEVTDFLYPVTSDTFGDDKLYEEYCSVVEEPMDISTIMAKVRTSAYDNKYQFKRDVELIFDNCREFNMAGTEIVHCANSLTIEFQGLWQEFDLN